MDDFVYKSYLFSSQEFMVLSAYAGMESFHILSGDLARRISKKELELTFFQLYQKGILFWKNGKSYEMKPEIRELFQVMKASRKELQIYPKRSGGPLLCFWADDVVVMEQSENDKNTVKLHSSSKKMFFEELRDRGILPAGDSPEIEASDRPGLFHTKDIKAGRINGEALLELLNEEDKLEAGIIIYDRRSQENIGIVLVLDNGIGDDVALIRDESSQISPYSPERLAAFFNM